jgi:hypothetical protein
VKGTCSSDRSDRRMAKGRRASAVAAAAAVGGACVGRQREVRESCESLGMTCFG